ncbi:MAG: carbamate kinase [Acidobacteria bacterium]|nr:carbamate kinase [Acidobacteriota bacterium]
MRVVVALGGNALLRRGEVPSAAQQRDNVRTAARVLAPVAREHELIISHGNGPQVGLLALQAASYDDAEPYPLDVLGAQTEGMIGYLIEQELGNELAYEQPFATILTMVEVDPEDPAFDNPTKPIGPVYPEADARELAAKHGWTIASEDSGWRRVVPSPRPKHIFEARPIQWLVDQGVVVICTGGGGIPTMYRDGRLVGAEVVVDKDLASALLAKQLGADLLVMATDVDGVYSHWGTHDAERLGTVKPADLADLDLAAGSMRPKVEAACAFVEATQGTAVIGSLETIDQMVNGAAGTRVVAAEDPSDVRLPGL